LLGTRGPDHAGEALRGQVKMEGIDSQDGF
jgi:hypothetical protein